MHDMTLTEAERLHLQRTDASAFVMDEEAFRAFYDRTARPLWAYLSRLTGDRQAADDLLQEAYYRFLRARAHHEDDHHRRNSLFRIATNLARDRHRRLSGVHNVSLEDHELHSDAHGASRVERRADLHRAMQQLRPRDRELLWLAGGDRCRDSVLPVGHRVAPAQELHAHRGERLLAQRAAPGPDDEAAVGGVVRDCVGERDPPAHHGGRRLARRAGRGPNARALPPRSGQPPARPAAGAGGSRASPGSS